MTSLSASSGNVVCPAIAWTSKSHYASSLLIRQNSEVPTVQRKRMLRVNAMATVNISCTSLLLYNFFHIASCHS